MRQQTVMRLKRVMAMRLIGRKGRLSRRPYNLINYKVFLKDTTRRMGQIRLRTTRLASTLIVLPE